MKLFSVFALASSVQAACPDGTAKNLNEWGTYQYSQVCRPTAANAKVNSCNNGDNEVEMEVTVYKKFFHEAPFGYTDHPTNTDMYIRTYTIEDIYVPDGLTKSFDATSNKLYLSAFLDLPATTAGTDVDGNTIYISTMVDFEFRCEYSLDDQKVSENIKVTGQDVYGGRLAEGQLYYYLEFNKAEYDLGDTVSFELKPKTASLVYARLKACDVISPEGNRATVFGLDGDYCRNGFVDFYSNSAHSYGSLTSASYSYKAFKWHTDHGHDQVEQQTLECTAEFGYTYVTDLPYRVYGYNPKCVSPYNHIDAEEQQKIDEENDGS